MREYTVTFKSWDMCADRLCARLEFHGAEKTIPQAASETNYPASFNAWSSLGDVSRGMGDTNSAVKCFTHSLELNLDNRHAAEQIQRLKPAAGGSLEGRRLQVNQ